MPEEEPIVLPWLRSRGPSAAVCANGHVLAWFLEEGVDAGFCPKCGEKALRSCPECHAPLPPDPEMLKWVPYHGYCTSCGEPYPWIAADVARARRTIEQQAQVEKWTDEMRTRGLALVDAIVAERATPSELLATVKWLELSGSENATNAILDAVGLLGGADLKTALRPHFPGLF